MGETGVRRAIPIRPRKTAHEFDDVPRWWLADNPIATHLANSLNLLFPAGERMFMRSVRRYQDRIGDETLRAQVKGFLGQESRHAQEHEKFFARLEAQGYEIRSFLAFYEKWAYGPGGAEARTPARMRLAVTVALEHFTAMFAEQALSRDFLAAAHPAMASLLRWHASEEIEHKAVAFDVLMAVHPEYGNRMAGLVFGTLGLLGFWAIGTQHLLRQDRLTMRELLPHVRDLFAGGDFGRGNMIKAFVQYLGRDFHPWDRDDLELAERWLAGAAAAV